MLYDIGMVEILPFANTVTGNPGKGRDRNLPITFCFRRHLITDQAILTQIFNLRDHRNFLSRQNMFQIFPPLFFFLVSIAMHPDPDFSRTNRSRHFPFLYCPGGSRTTQHPAQQDSYDTSFSFLHLPTCFPKKLISTSL